MQGRPKHCPGLQSMSSPGAARSLQLPLVWAEAERDHLLTSGTHRTSVSVFTFLQRHYSIAQHTLTIVELLCLPI